MGLFAWLSFIAVPSIFAGGISTAFLMKLTGVKDHYVFNTGDVWLDNIDCCDMHMHDGHHSINVLIGRIKKIWIYMRNKDYLLPMKIFRRYEDIQELEGPRRKFSVIICNFIWDIFGNKKNPQNRQERNYKKNSRKYFLYNL